MARTKRFARVGIMLFLIIGVVLYGYTLFRNSVIGSDVKGFAEKKISEILHADISIGSVNIGLLKYISLSGLKIDRSRASKLWWLVDVKKIVVTYDIMNFFRTNLTTPNHIYLLTPSIQFSKLAIPQQLFNQKMPGLPGKSALSLEVRNGTMTYTVPFLKTKFVLTNIDGRIMPHLQDELQIDFAAKGGEDVSGDVVVNGTINQKNQELAVDVLLKNVAIQSSSFIPIKGLDGELKIKNHDIIITKARFYVRNIPFSVTGTIQNYDRDPTLDIVVTIESKKGSFSSRFVGPYRALTCEGFFSFMKFHYGFRGDVHLTESSVVVDNVLINNKCYAQGEFVFSEGVYTLRLKKGQQDILCKFSHEEYRVTIDLALNHIALFDYDVVVVGRVELEPDLSFWRNEKLVLNASIETDYLVFNYTPLKDFKGTFTVSPDAVTNVKCTWGNAHTVTGSVQLKEPQEVNAKLELVGYNLRDIDTLGGYLISKDLEGTVNGTATITGPLTNPWIDARFTCGEGSFRNFDFKKVALNLSGDRHKLSLYDSRIFRSSNIFYLRGTVDFDKRNIFSDVVLESGEKIVLWRGWDMTKEETEDMFKIRKSLLSNVDLNVVGALRSQETDETAGREGSLSLQYNHTKDQNTSLMVEEGRDDETVALKHTISF